MNEQGVREIVREAFEVLAGRVAAGGPCVPLSESIYGAAMDVSVFHKPAEKPEHEPCAKCRQEAIDVMDFSGFAHPCFKAGCSECRFMGPPATTRAGALAMWDAEQRRLREEKEKAAGPPFPVEVGDEVEIEGTVSSYPVEVVGMNGDCIWSKDGGDRRTYLLAQVARILKRPDLPVGAHVERNALPGLICYQHGDNQYSVIWRTGEKTKHHRNELRRTA